MNCVVGRKRLEKQDPKRSNIERGCVCKAIHSSSRSTRPGNGVRLQLEELRLEFRKHVSYKERNLK